MLILVLIDAQHLQNVVFSFEEGSKSTLLKFPTPNKKSPSKISYPTENPANQDLTTFKLRSNSSVVGCCYANLKAF